MKKINVVAAFLCLSLGGIAANSAVAKGVCQSSLPYPGMETGSTINGPARCNDGVARITHVNGPMRVSHSTFPESLTVNGPLQADNAKFLQALQVNGPVVLINSSVDKLIMIAAPNKGISGKVSNYCPILGEKKECNDMSENSIFIKKLNDPFKIPQNAEIHNIVGIGCSMDKKTGDGIVTKQNAEIDFAENYYINGTCTRLRPLHTQILDIEQYPEVYDTISSILKKS